MKELTEFATSLPLESGNLHRQLLHLLEQVWGDYCSSFKQCRAEFSAASVHRLRVKSRRLLTLLNLLEFFIGRAPVALAYDLVKRRLRRLGSLRDTQVQLLEVEDKLKSFPDAKTFHQALCRRERRLLRQLGARFGRAHLGKIRAAMFDVREESRRALTCPAREQQHRDVLTDGIRQAFNHVNRLRSRCRAGKLKSFHRLRVALKQYRYLVELVRPVFRCELEAELKALRKVHDRLGAIQDARVLVDGLEEFCRRHPAQSAALQTFCRAARHRRDLLVKRFLAAAWRIHDFSPPSRFQRNRGVQVRKPFNSCVVSVSAR